MRSVTRIRSLLQALLSCTAFLLLCGCVSRTAEGQGEADTAAAPAASATEAQAPAGSATAGAAAVADPTLVPPVVWLPKGTDVPDAVAKTEADMKPYTETVPGAKIRFDMTPIRGGTFMMGSPPGEKDREACEGPQIKVELEPFWMGTCEVTWDEYEQWMVGLDVARRRAEKVKGTFRDELADAITRPTDPYSDMTFGMGRDRYPAICMTQLSAILYCKWLSAKTGRYYRLPTEAEWEYACRAGTSTAYSFGEDAKNLGDYAWYAGNSDEKYHKVGEKKPNPWGLYDMHGNVTEWVLGHFTEAGYKRFAGQTVKDPFIPSTKMWGRVVRGGSWMDDPPLLRSASRTYSDPSWKEQDPQFPQSVFYHTDAEFAGFRIVRPLRTPTEEEAARYDLDTVQRAAFAEYKEFKGL